MPRAGKYWTFTAPSTQRDTTQTRRIDSSEDNTTTVQSARNAKTRERRQALAAAKNTAAESGAEPTGTEREEEPNDHHDNVNQVEPGNTTEDEPALNTQDIHTDKYEEAKTQDKDKQPAQGIKTDLLVSQ
jgi:hypothetical protein